MTRPSDDEKSQSPDLAPSTVSRRDFMNGALLASGAWMVSQSIPLRAFTAAARADTQPAKVGADACDGPMGTDPRALRGGNLPAAFRVAHWMRDGRLSFASAQVTLAAGCDSQKGKFAVADDPESYDVIISGSGISGLSAAFFIRRSNPKARILILDANAHFGGNAGRDEGGGLPVMASTAGSYGVAPYADYLREIYRQIGVDWERYKIVNPMYSYFFDDRTPGVRKGHRGWNLDSYGKGVSSFPYSPEVVAQLTKCKQVFREWASKDGAPTDPADASDPAHDALSTRSLHDYLTQTLGCDPVVSDFYTAYTVDALGGAARDVNAHSAIAFLGSEYGELFAFPGGTSGVARHLIRWLIPDVIEGKHVLMGKVRSDRLDRSGQGVRVRQGAVVVRADPETGGGKATTPGASVIYCKDGKFYRCRARSVVLAGQAHTAQHVVEHLLDAPRKKAWTETKMVPVIVANVAIKSAAPLVDAGFGYNQYWWGSKYWADFVIADWAMPELRKKRDRPTVLTFFGGNWAPPHELAVERFNMISTPFSEYEKSIKDDLSRVMTGTKFDFDRDVTAIYLYRWGHGMMMPTPGHTFGTTLGSNGKIDRSKGPRHIACAPIGTIFFAGQDTEGTPSVESAIASGQRVARQVLA
jgi:spermidine dehydrogenase